MIRISGVAMVTKRITAGITGMGTMEVIVVIITAGVGVTIGSMAAIMLHRSVSFFRGFPSISPRSILDV